MAKRRGSVSVTVQGMGDALKALQGLADGANDVVLLEAAQAGAEIVRAEAQVRAPRSAGVGHMPGGGHAADHIITKPSEKPGEASVRVGTDKDAFYLWFHETGTSNLIATPFLRPALDEKRAEVIEAMSAVLRKHQRRVVE